MSIFKNILNLILNIFRSKTVSWFKNEVSNVKDGETAITAATHFVYNLGNFVLSPDYKGSLLDLVVPEYIDEKAKKILEDYLEEAASLSPFISGQIKLLGEDPTIDQIIETINKSLIYLKENDPNLYALTNHTLASLFAEKLSGKLIGSIFAVIEAVWQAVTKKHILPITEQK